MNKVKVLLVDDDPASLTTLTDFLRLQGFKVLHAPSLKTAYRSIEVEAPDVTIVNYELPDGDAIGFLTTVQSANPTMKSIVLTSHANMDLAARAIQEGAEHFLTKPVQCALLGSAVGSCVDRLQTQRKQLARKMRASRYEKDPFQGTSQLIRHLAQEASKIVHTERPILIQGETGTGKGVLAQWLHKHGPRSEEALVEVNCAGWSKNLLESELFGYEKGAFTGAASSKHGLVEVSHRGILFLDELGEMELTVQPKLLKILEDNRFRRLGETRERVADIQIIAATNRNLMQSVEQMTFREDLYFRISTFQLRIPPLRERAEDIPILAQSILGRLSKDLARERQKLSPGATAALQAYSWPGNLRELRNVLERVALTCAEPVIEAHDLALTQRASKSTTHTSLSGSAVTLAELEREHITRVLQEEAGRVAQAAIRLGIPRSTLYQKIKAYGISTETAN